jgi:hypothetical protein
MTEIGPGWSNIIAPILQDEHHADAAAQKVVLRGTDSTNFFNAAVVSTASGPALVTLGGGDVNVVSSITINVSGSFSLAAGSTVTANQGTPVWVCSVVSQVSAPVTAFQGGAPWTVSVLSAVTTNVIVTGIPTISVVSNVTTNVVVTGIPTISVVSQVTTPVVITGTPIVSVVSQVTTNVVIPGVPTVSIVSSLSLPVIAVGNIAHDSPDSSAPLKIGGRYHVSAAVALNDRVDARFSDLGFLGIFIADGSNGNYASVGAGGGLSVTVTDDLGTGLDVSATDGDNISGTFGAAYVRTYGLLYDGSNYDRTRGVAGIQTIAVVSQVTTNVVITGTPIVSVVSQVTTNVVVTGTPIVSVVSQVTTNVVRPMYRSALTTVLSSITFDSATTTANGATLTTAAGSWLELEYTITSFGVGAQRIQLIPQFSSDAGTTWATVDSGPEANMHFEDTEFVAVKTLSEIIPIRGTSFRPVVNATGTTDALKFSMMVRASERQQP